MSRKKDKYRALYKETSGRAQQLNPLFPMMIYEIDT